MTTINTSSINLFNKIRNYINNKRIFFTTSLSNGVYTISIINLNSREMTSLIEKMVKHFRLSPKSQQEPHALAA